MSFKKVPIITLKTIVRTDLTGLGKLGKRGTKQGSESLRGNHRNIKAWG